MTPIDFATATTASADGTLLQSPILGADGQPIVKAVNPLDAPEAQDTLAMVSSWYDESVDLHAENRAEMLLDGDFYDHDQWDPGSVAELANRHQNASTFNLIAPVINWIVGTERRTRVDWAVYPRNSEAQEKAEAKAKLLKFVSDANGVPFARSKMFKQKVINGVGWMHEFAQTDPQDGIPVSAAWVDWRRVYWDAYSRNDDLSDCRFTHLQTYLDLDYAIALFPDRADKLRGAAARNVDSAMELIEDDYRLPQAFLGTESPFLRRGSLSLGGTASVNRKPRQRVRLIETEYRRPIASKRVRLLVTGYDRCAGAAFDPNDSEMAELLAADKIALDDVVTSNIWLAVWAPGVLCRHMQSPYKHNRFSLTPDWAYRRHRDGMPYGMVRGLRDPQEEYNKRRSKALFAASVNRVIYEEDAIAEDMREEALEQASRPDGEIRLSKGGFSRFKIETNVDIGQAHMNLMALAKDDIYSTSSVTRENMGQDGTAISGRAILAKQQQGAVGTAELFDNYRQSIQLSGQKMLSLTEQYLTQPMQVRVLGEKEGAEWLAVNQPLVDPVSGQVVFHNDITNDQADFVVDEQDYRETVRMAMAEMLMDTISKMPPDVAIKLLDLAIDLTDIPNRAAFVARIRKINGEDKDTPLTPEEQQQAQAAQQQAAEDRALAVDKAKSEIQKNNAAAQKLAADAHGVAVGTKANALNVARDVARTPVFAPAADRIASGPLPAGQLSDDRPPLLGPPPLPGAVPLPNPPAPAPAVTP